MNRAVFRPSSPVFFRFSQPKKAFPLFPEDQTPDEAKTLFDLRRANAGGSEDGRDYSSSTLTGLPVAMDSLQAMVNATDLKASR